MALGSPRAPPGLAPEARVPVRRASTLRTPASKAEVTLESADYLACDGDQIYTVTHAAAPPRRGAVLVCGPFGVERERSYLTLVQWARALAVRGFEVLRFDYRGTGESSGAFESATLARWQEDVARCAQFLAANTQGSAVVLHGVRLGALLAAQAFADGQGEGLLMWSPPPTAEALLREVLRHTLIAERLAHPEALPRTRDELVAALEAGASVLVDGYPWTRAQWMEARQRRLILPESSDRRPWHTLRTRGEQPLATDARADGHQECVNSDTFWCSSTPWLVPHHEEFERASLEWLDRNEPWRARSP